MGPTEFHRLADRELNEAAQYYELEAWKRVFLEEGVREPQDPERFRGT